MLRVFSFDFSKLSLEGKLFFQYYLRAQHALLSYRALPTYQALCCVSSPRIAHQHQQSLHTSFISGLRNIVTTIDKY